MDRNYWQDYWENYYKFMAVYLRELQNAYPDADIKNEYAEVANLFEPPMSLEDYEDYDLFEKYGKDSVENPDFVIKDGKHDGTVFMVKKLQETNLNVVVRVVIETDKEGLKNSVMTFYRIRERNLRKLIDKNSLLYKKE